MSATSNNEFRLAGPAFVRLTDGRWFLPENLTLAQWRDARAAAAGTDKHSLSQFKFATLMIEDAVRHRLPEGAVVLSALGYESDLETTVRRAHRLSTCVGEALDEKMAAESVSAAEGSMRTTDAHLRQISAARKSG